MPPFVVGIAGGSGAGKSTLAGELARAAAPVLIVEIDWYYRDLSRLPPDERAQANFDHPDSLDWDLLREQLGALARGEGVDRPVYDFSTHTREPAPIRVEPAPLIIVEGILALHDPPTRALMDFKIYVDSPPALRLERRLVRDVNERGRSKSSVELQFERTVTPMHDLFVEPTRRFADWQADGAGTAEATLLALLARRR